MDFNINYEKPVKCKHCGKLKGQHKAQTFHCPIGSKTRVGYIHYSREQVYEPKKAKNSL